MVDFVYVLGEKLRTVIMSTCIVDKIILSVLYVPTALRSAARHILRLRLAAQNRMAISYCKHLAKIYVEPQNF
jgi:hypothetical protein